ncbi:hypothetical protein V1477_012964 [Vespula maculifrons]|uniref:Uncharacterized protein n=1 Tax=Vespula maculifrons TaxID=7453 RepID=A0ABD2BUS8_VESMC
MVELGGGIFKGSSRHAPRLRLADFVEVVVNFVARVRCLNVVREWFAFKVLPVATVRVEEQ